MPVNVSFLQDLLNTIADQGRHYLPASLVGGAKEDINTLAEVLISGRGEASGVVIARQILDFYRGMTPDAKREFFRFLSHHFQPDEAGLAAAARAYLADPGETTLAKLRLAIESPRQEFFRRLNLAPGATAEIVAMRRDLLRLPKGEPGITAVDTDMAHLLASWFNRGFLVVKRIDWQTPAAILEKIIQYEAVHEIQGWEDLRRRLDPADRRCFAFFHPSLIDEPLIFVEVALMSDIPVSIQAVLNEKRKGGPTEAAPTTAVFYSISNCQDGLRGISFGNFLIKQVVEELVREQPQLKTFVTLSPVPSFARWLDRALAGSDDGVVTEADRIALQVLRDPGWLEDPEEDETLKRSLLALAAHYFLGARSADGRAIDPVARFHLGNGARLERINWLGDVSEKGLREAHGLMVNYRYELKEIERNHEAYANLGDVAASRAVRSLLRAQTKAKSKATVTLALPDKSKEPKPSRSKAD